MGAEKPTASCEGGDGRRVQLVTVWLLPIIVGGGLVWPPLGLVAAAMMAALLGMSIFRGRYWCGNICPRGAFLDLGLRRIVPRRKFPALLRGLPARAVVLTVMMGTMVYLFAVMPLTLYGAGAMFVRMCLVTTVGAIALGMLTQERAWCAICPMGTLQNLISRAAARVHVHVDAESCRACTRCERVCPMDIPAQDYLEAGKVLHADCLRCYECVAACPFGALSVGERVPDADEEAELRVAV